MALNIYQIGGRKLKCVNIRV